jgi:hypothetical protein
MNYITLTKTKFAIGLVAMALLVPATAWATHTFSDVEDGRFYTEAVEWAFENNITTGTSDTTFSPDDPVTRGQNVTFAKRYDDNIVQPALTEMSTTVAADSAAAFANGNNTEIEIGSGVTVQSLSMTAPADGIVIANSAVRIDSADPTFVGCSLRDEAAHDGAAQQAIGLASDIGTSDNIANTQGFDVTAGEEITIYLYCTQLGSGASAYFASITAIFTAG